MRELYLFRGCVFGKPDAKCVEQRAAGKMHFDEGEIVINQRTKKGCFGERGSDLRFQHTFNLRVTRGVTICFGSQADLGSFAAGCQQLCHSIGAVEFRERIAQLGRDL